MIVQVAQTDFEDGFHSHFSQLTSPPEAGEVEIDITRTNFMTPMALVSLLAFIDYCKKLRARVSFTQVEKSPAYQYLQRMDFFGIVQTETLTRRDPGNRFVTLKRMTLLGLILVATLASGCGERDAAIPVASTIPPKVSKAFTEDTASIRLLRRWVADALPLDTSILSYHSETAWDGTVFERWLFHSPSGFAALTQKTDQRTAMQVPSDSAYKTVERPLRKLGVELSGERPPSVWSVHWRVQTNNTNVRGLILPHASGEILEVERITLK